LAVRFLGDARGADGDDSLVGRLEVLVQRNRDAVSRQRVKRVVGWARRLVLLFKLIKKK